MTQYNDVINIDVIDTYNNLSLKSIEMLKWTSKHCAGAKYLLKVDDDTYVNTTALIVELEAHKRQQHTHGIYGRRYTRRTPQRSPSSRYYTPYSVWRHKHWPHVVTGPAYVISVSVIDRLLEKALLASTPFVTMEDIYITGLVRHYANVSLYDLKDMRHQATRCYNVSAVSYHRVSAGGHYLLWRNKTKSCIARKHNINYREQKYINIKARLSDEAYGNGKPYGNTAYHGNSARLKQRLNRHCQTRLLGYHSARLKNTGTPDPVRNWSNYISGNSIK